MRKIKMESFESFMEAAHISKEHSISVLFATVGPSGFVHGSGGVSRPSGAHAFFSLYLTQRKSVWFHCTWI